MSESALRGQRIFQAACSTCHHADSTAPINGPGLKGVFDKKFLPSGAPATDDKVRETILNGRKSMPGFSAAFDERQINDIIAYLHSI